MHGADSDRSVVVIRLTREHFAFFRGYLENLDLKMLAKRYLQAESSFDEVKDLRVAKSRIEWIRKQLIVIANRTGEASKARLLSLSPDRLHLRHGSSVPTLEEFRDKRDPYEVYSEKELMALYEEEYEVPSISLERRIERNQRLRVKQLALLAELESRTALDLKAEDMVEGWLNQALAKRLNAAGIMTIGHLAEFINGYGYRWYTQVPKIGEKAASKIVAWLNSADTRRALGITLHARSLKKKKDLSSQVPAPYKPSTAIVPLELFLVPKDLDGSCGSNRGSRQNIQAENDLQAVLIWLSQWNPESSTYRSYRLEAERFMLWSILEKRKALSSLAARDCQDYRDFLAMLGTFSHRNQRYMSKGEDTWSKRFKIPQEQWIGSRPKAPRWSSRWRPFQGRLKASSQIRALTILNSLMQWLDSHGYLIENPLKGLYQSLYPIKMIHPERSFTEPEWRALCLYLRALKRHEETDWKDRAENDRFYRIRFLLSFASGTGIRLSEMANLRRHHFSYVLKKGKKIWYAEFRGRGDRQRKVVIPSKTIEHIDSYFMRRWHVNFEQSLPETPLIARLPLYDAKTKEAKRDTADIPVLASQIAQLFKAFFRNAASHYESIDPSMARIIRSASTHWLRHTHAIHAFEMGIDLVTVHQNLGNGSILSTQAYLDDERSRASLQADMFGPTL